MCLRGPIDLPRRIGGDGRPPLDVLPAPGRDRGRHLHLDDDPAGPLAAPVRHDLAYVWARLVDEYLEVFCRQDLGLAPVLAGFGGGGAEEAQDPLSEAALPLLGLPFIRRGAWTIAAVTAVYRHIRRRRR